MEIPKRRATLAAIGLDTPRTREEIVSIYFSTGLILCGGLGTRLKDITWDRTVKPAVSLTRKNFIIDVPISIMRHAGIRDIYLVTSSPDIDALRHHTGYVDKKNGIHYFSEGTPKGPMAALQTFIREVKPQAPIIKANGDEVFINLDLKAMYNKHTQNQQPITGFLTDDPGGSRVFTIFVDNDANGKATRVDEYPFLSNLKGGYHETGLWIINPTQFDLIMNSNSWEEFLRKALARGVLYGYPTHTQFFNVNTPSDLVKARFALDHQH